MLSDVSYCVAGYAGYGMTAFDAGGDAVGTTVGTLEYSGFEWRSLATWTCEVGLSGLLLSAEGCCDLWVSRYAGAAG